MIYPLFSDFSTFVFHMMIYPLFSDFILNLSLLPSSSSWTPSTYTDSPYENHFAILSQGYQVKLLRMTKVTYMYAVAHLHVSPICPVHVVGACRTPTKFT